jgi:hypothetical protein
MTNFIQQLIIIVCIIGIAAVAAFFIFINSVGRNFVHDRPASDEYYQNISNRIYFTTKYRGDKFDTLLSKFLQKNSQYSLPDSIHPQLIGDSNCNCNCLPLQQFVYFDNLPNEIYYLTYDHDTMYAAGAGVIDIVFSFKNKEWACTKTSKLDSTEKARIENRLDTAVLNKLPKGF